MQVNKKQRTPFRSASEDVLVFFEHFFCSISLSLLTLEIAGIAGVLIKVLTMHIGLCFC